MVNHNNNINFSLIIKDNESAAATAYQKGDYIFSFLLIHSLIESLLRSFLNETDKKEVKFANLIEKYKKKLKKEYQKEPITFYKELREFNKRRNRIIHQLWRKGYTYTNNQAKDAAMAALYIYPLFIEWLETFDDNIHEFGFTV